MSEEARPDGRTGQESRSVMVERPPFHSRLITDPRVLGVLDELYERERRVNWEAYPHDPDPFRHAGTGFSLSPEQGDQLYLLVRHGRASHVVEFATSLGFSTIFLAAAVRDCGKGRVYTAELVPEKVQQARENLARAGLGDYVTVLEGDARKTLAAVPDGIDFALIDGWEPIVSLDVLKLIEPKLRSGALVYNENQDREFLEYVQAPDSGYGNVPLLSGSSYKPQGELSLRR
ncbi:class I SAM-dependent methyltransferase [Streptomyces sp. YIM 130001]|uniref:O-methyltransferase n=1 Tax=Streptomyces sp. YIM 130001 TaxID=2259644 RepID=UPI001F09F4DF|nr:class I SAM-dependent methyltransferase [Streptomyces sp. YIM 130001]